MAIDNNNSINIIKNLKEQYNLIAKVPLIISGRIFNGDGEYLQIASIRSNHSVQMKKIIRMQQLSVIKECVVSPYYKIISTSSTALANLDSQLVTYSSDNKKMVSLIMVNDNMEKKQYIRVFNRIENLELCCVDVTTPKMHGVIHEKSPFGGFKWSSNGDKILYVAEKEEKATEFFDASLDWNDANKIQESHIGEKFKLFESWGEQQYDVRRPKLCIFNVTTATISVLDQISDEISPTFSVWGPNDEGIVFFGLKNVPFKLGRSFCNNRRGALYYYEIESKRLSMLSELDVSIENIIFSPDMKKMVYFERKSGGPHNSSLAMILYDWYNKTAKVVVSTVDFSFGKDGFPGLYDVDFPERCWSTDNGRIIFSSAWSSKKEVICVNTKTASLQKLTNLDAVHGSWIVRDVSFDHILVEFSSPSIPPSFFLAKLPESGAETKIIWTKIDEIKTSLQRTFCQTWQIINFAEEGFDFHEGILILPRGDKPHPLVVYPHGGPHSISLAAWSRISHALLTLSGFAVLLVNYRGSIGFGDNFVHSLLGNCGDFDVKDVHNSVLNILRKVENIDENNIFVMGSSHGGFLASNLIGQYPGFYKACVAINPVLNVCSMFDLSDIADWAAVEGLGVDVDWCKMPTIEQRQKMHECSPVAHVHKVITPYMLAIGAKDLRVVDHSRSFIRNLLARDIPTKVLIYPNSNHCIEEVECNADLMINAVLWFYLHSHHT